MEWMFNVKDGFDIVIGNPPYVLLQNTQLPLREREHLLRRYLAAQYKVDLYHLFIETGVALLASSGLLSYITPNTFLKNTYNNKLRETLATGTNIHTIVLFYCRVFEDPSVDNVVFICQRARSLAEAAANTISVVDVRHGDVTQQLRANRNFPQASISAPAYSFELDVTSETADILGKIEHGTVPFGKIGGTYFGIQTFDRAAFVFPFHRNRFCRPVIDGGNVFRYYTSASSEYVDFRPKNLKSGGDPEIYAKQRIVVRQIGRYPEGALCPDGMLTLNTIYNLYLTDTSFDLKYILALLNSSVMRFYWLQRFYDNKETFPKIKKQPLHSLPVRPCSPAVRQMIVATVERLLATKGADPAADTSALEREIDAHVYELYGLTPDEIAIVESKSNKKA